MFRNTHYNTLNLPTNATQGQIKKAYLEQRKKYDGIWNTFVSLFSSNNLDALNEAYAILSSSTKRKAYHRKMNLPPPPEEYGEYLDDIKTTRRCYLIAREIRAGRYQWDDDSGTSKGNKVWNRIEADLQELDGNSFFMIGSPIPVKRPHRPWYLSFTSQIRESIPDAELVGSFPQSGDVTLFRCLFDALIYARANSVSTFNTETFAQPAIFKVNYIHHPQDLIANNNIVASMLDLKFFNYESPPLLTKSNLRLTSYITSIQNVLPKQVTLKLRTERGDKDYPCLEIDATNQPRQNAINIDDDNPFEAVAITSEIVNHHQQRPGL